MHKFLYGNDFKLIDLTIEQLVSGKDYERVESAGKNDLINSLNTINLFKPSIINIANLDTFSETDIEEIISKTFNSQNKIIFFAKINIKYKRKFNKNPLDIIEMYIPDEKDFLKKILDYSSLLGVELSNENISIIKDSQSLSYVELQNAVYLTKILPHSISITDKSETPPWKIVDVLANKISLDEVNFDLFPLISYLQNRVKEAIFLLEEVKPFPYNLYFLKKCNLIKLLDILNLTIKFDYLVKKNSTLNLQNIFIKELQLLYNSNI